MKEQKTCPHCGRPLMAGDTECGYCGAKLGGGSGKKLLVWVLAVAIVAGLGLGGWWLYRNDPLGLMNPPIPDVPEDVRIPDDTLSRAIADAREAIEFFPYSEENLVDYLETIDYMEHVAQRAAAECGADWNANALARIDMSLEDPTDGYSREGLAEVLYWAGFTQEQIDYAMEHLPEIDWQEQASRCAASYLDAIPMSRAGLMDQLEYEGFAPELLEAAVDSCGADWAENALAAAREEPFYKSDHDIRSLLEADGFTDEEIEYAIENR